MEHPVERARQHRLLIEFLRTGRGISFPEMFAMKEYPADVLPLYSQGYSLARYLIERGGRKRYIQFVGDGLASSDWPESLSQYYGIHDIGKLQTVWLEWVKRGCPAPPASVAASIPQVKDIAQTTRGQSPDGPYVKGPARNRISATAARQSIYVQRAQRTQRETNRN